MSVNASHSLRLSWLNFGRAVRTVISRAIESTSESARLRSDSAVQSLSL